MSTLQTIGLGTVDDDGTGDSLKTAGGKITANFTALNTDKAELSGATFTGNVVIQKTTPALDLRADTSDYCDIYFKTGSSLRWIISKDPTAESGSNAGSDLLIRSRTDAGASLANVLQITRSNSLTKMIGVYSNTTASAANVYVSSDGSMLRSTSSPIFKKIIEPISPEYSKNIFEIARKCTVFYKSLSEHDNKEWTFYGLDANKVAEIEPRLAHWGYFEDDYEIIEKKVPKKVQEKDKSGNIIEKTVIEIEKEKQLKPGVQMKPSGVQYERFVPLMLIEMDRQQSEIESLKKEIEEIKKLLK